MSLLSKSAREKADAARYCIKQFVQEAASEIPDGSSVLDAGAGNCRYRGFFTRHRYMPVDFCQVEGKNYKQMKLVTDLTKMGLKDDSVDAAINIQVLEHVSDPKALVMELGRVLKPSGMLYLSCPQNWGVHEAPYDFYRFTSFALEDIFRKSGLEVVYIRPMGGYFRLMAKLLSRMHFQIDLPECSSSLRKMAHKISQVVLKEVFHYWVPYALYHLDFLDRKKDFTIGYVCLVRKPSEG